MIDPDVRAADGADVEALTELEVEARAALVDARGGRRWLEEHPLIGGAWAQASPSAPCSSPSSRRSR